ncbi:hypothetical protein DITRI_Ditri07aG0111600 [Diplodiscus trichospermus]
MGLVSVFLDILRKPTIGGVVSELLMFVAPLWVAVIVGVLVGWAWKPKWANLGREMSIDCSGSKDSSPPSKESSSMGFGSISNLNFVKFQLPSCISWTSDDGVQKDCFSLPPTLDSNCSSSRIEKEKTGLVTDEDLENLCKLVEEKDGGPDWIHMMERSTPTMYYQAWRRDLPIGPTQYRSQTVFDDATPEMVREFFWDDEFRAKSRWDEMLLNAATLEECPTAGTMVVHWVRKFPFFCSDREYIIGRRIWESGRVYYCVTKGVPYPSVPRKSKPRRVELYYSSWCIRAVESRKGDGQLTACEVLLFHHENMGIPWEIAKLGVQLGMWGTVKRIDPGLRAYQKERASGVPLSHCALMAQINTKVSADYLKSLESNANDSSELKTHTSSEKQLGKNIPKLLVVGGAIAVACILDRGLLTKAVIFGVARRFAKFGRRL